MISWRSISNYSSITRISHSICATIDNLITIKILKNHISRIDYVAIRINKLCIYIRIARSVIIINLLLIAEKSITYISPNLSNLLTYIIIT